MLPAAAPFPVDTIDIPSSTTIDQDAPSANLSSEESSSRDVIPSNLHQVSQPFDNLRKWKKDHLFENVIGNPS
ncbi:hypothetical protein Tco_0796349 [Tanacetum coccineum]